VYICVEHLALCYNNDNIIFRPETDTSDECQCLNPQFQQLVHNIPILVFNKFIWNFLRFLTCIWPSTYQIMQQLKVEKYMGAWLIICTTVQEQVETSMNEICMQK